VQKALVQLGIALDRLDVVGFGDTKPVASNRTALGRAANERIELVIVAGP